MHADIVVNHWHDGFQRRVGRVVVEPDDEGWASQILHELFESFCGSYRFITDGHTDDDCPFKDGDEIAMQEVPVFSASDGFGPCPDCGCAPERHNAVNRVDVNPFGGPLLIAHCADDGACWRATENFAEEVRVLLDRSIEQEDESGGSGKAERA